MDNCCNSTQEWYVVFEQLRTFFEVLRKFGTCMPRSSLLELKGGILTST